MIKNFILKSIFYFDTFIRKRENYFIFSSFPDMSDNSFAMFKYMFETQKNGKFIWFLLDSSKINEYKKFILENIDIGNRDLNNVLFIKKNSFLGLYYYYQAKYIFYTHNLYPGLKLPKNHIIINLWHGMPLKKVGLLDPENKGIPIFSYAIATSITYQKILSKVFGVKEELIMVAGQPRNDLLFENRNKLLLFGINKKNYTKIFLWTPTYRHSIVGDIREDSNITTDSLPIIDDNFYGLNRILKHINAYMIIKLHPMDVLTAKEFDSYSNLTFLKNCDLEDRCCQLNSLLGEADVLLTDFSSIYIDYLLLDRPIGFTMDDFNEYNNARGFIMENTREYMPGKFISSKDDLFNFLIQCTKNIDNYKIRRAEVNSILNIQKKNFSEYLWRMIEEKKIK